jgi:hypothetical protein
LYSSRTSTLQHIEQHEEDVMTRNMSNLDRGLRTFVAAPAAVIAAVLAGAGSVGGVVLFAIAAVMLATSAVGFCPLYRLLHIDTSGRTPLPR